MKWLFKTEPTEYSFEDLRRDGKTVWSGVANATALIHLRKAKTGDEVLVYHTGTERRAVGRARITRGPYPDPTKKDPKLVVVDLAPGKPLANPVTLAQMKECGSLEGFDLLRIGRLSIVPVSEAHWTVILGLSGG